MPKKFQWISRITPTKGKKMSLIQYEADIDKMRAEGASVEEAEQVQKFVQSLNYCILEGLIVEAGEDENGEMRWKVPDDG